MTPQSDERKTVLGGVPSRLFHLVAVWSNNRGWIIPLLLFGLVVFVLMVMRFAYLLMWSPKHLG